MKLLPITIVFWHLCFAVEDLAQATKISIQDADLLMNAFGLTDEQENRILKEGNSSTIKELLQESSEGFTDRYNKFKLIPCRHYFNLYRKVNNQYKYTGKIMYPKKYFRPESVMIAQDGKSFASVFSKYDTKAEIYVHKLFVWRQQDNNPKSYERFMLGAANSAALSQNGQIAVGFDLNDNKIYYWAFQEGYYKLVDDAYTHDLSTNTVMGINGDGSRFFILDTILPAGHRYLPMFLYTLDDNNIKIHKRFELPAKIAYADLNDTGNEMAIAYSLQERFFANYQLSPAVSKSHLVVLDLSNLDKPTELLAFLNINRTFDRVRLKYDGKSILLGDGNFYSIYDIGPVLQRKVEIEKPQIDCQKILADFSYLEDLDQNGEDDEDKSPKI